MHRIPIGQLPDGAWHECRVRGEAVDFSEILPADDYLHPVEVGAHFTAVETNLYGFNIPEMAIQCNIYVLWHHALRTMSVHIFVYKGDDILPHQLAADYFMENLYLPAVTDNSDWTVTMGSCTVRMKVVTALEEILIQFEDAAQQFALDLTCRAAMPPVGRPGGKHFTQLLKTSGTLVLDGQSYRIDGHYMRDRSWGYNRPEQAERAPPYRWMTGWFGNKSGFVIAWLDTGLLDAPEFGSDWNRIISGPDATGGNKWESGGKTPSLNLRSGWISTGGTPIPVTDLTFRTLTTPRSPFLAKAVSIDMTDAQGAVHHITGQTRSMYPKMYWQTMLTYMHFMNLDMNGHSGHGDLMDTYSGHHIRKFGI